MNYASLPLVQLLLNEIRIDDMIPSGVNSEIMIYKGLALALFVVLGIFIIIRDR